MFKKLFGPKEKRPIGDIEPDPPKTQNEPSAAPAAPAEPADTRRFMPMQALQLDQVIDIIEQTDEDDAQEARESIQADMFEGMYVVMEAGKLVGVTGSFAADEDDQVAWLSWTYVDQSVKGTGVGNYMVNEMLNILHADGIRKLFIATSDYVEDGKSVYGDAHTFYESLGAKEECRIANYHDSGEAKIIYGLENPSVEPIPMDMGEPPVGLSFDELTDAPESEGGMAVSWSEVDGGVRGIDTLIDQAKAKQARVIFTALPEDFSTLAEATLEDRGFTEQGRVSDLYAPGLAQVWWSLELGKS